MPSEMYEVGEMEWTFVPRSNTVCGGWRCGQYEIDNLTGLGVYLPYQCEPVYRTFEPKTHKTLELAKAACVADRAARLEALGARRVK